MQSYKIALVGDFGVGKSSIVERATHDQFSERGEATIGAAFMTYTDPEHDVKFEIWDTAGQERFRSIVLATYLRNISCCLVVVDVTNRASFETLYSGWIKNVRQHVNVPDNIIIYLVASKCDLPRAISTEELENFAKAYDLEYYETSAKEGRGIIELFSGMARDVSTRDVFQEKKPSVVNLTPDNGSSKCCSV